MELVSKATKSMQQVPEMARVARRRLWTASVGIRGLPSLAMKAPALVAIRGLLQCSILFLFICGAGCDSHSKRQKSPTLRHQLRRRTAEVALLDAACPVIRGPWIRN